MKITEQPTHFHRVIKSLQVGDEFFWEPVRLAPPVAWAGHLATAFWLTKAIRPRIFVELGTHSGNSYSAFCQAIALLGLPTRAFAVDTWRGDEQAGFYGDDVFDDLRVFNEGHFGGFSKLLRTTFDEARAYFADGSIDLLHIDGLHSYEVVKHDFETWKTAASSRAVMVFHDTNVREKGFGVWKLWQELTESYPSFEFFHSEGLGILGLGQNQSPLLSRLFEMGRDPETSARVQRLFLARGESFSNRGQVLQEAAAKLALEAELERLRKVEETAREQGSALAKAMSDAAAAHEEAGRLRAAIPVLEAELERLRKVEETAREHASIIAKALSDAASLHHETIGLREEISGLQAETARLGEEAAGLKIAKESLELELERLRKDATAVQEQNVTLLKERDLAQDEAAVLRRQLHISALLARQQGLGAQRARMDLVAAKAESDRYKAESDRYKEESDRYKEESDRYRAAYRQAAVLLIPLRLRQSLPEPVKRPLRALKRALRSIVPHTS